MFVNQTRLLEPYLSSRFNSVVMRAGHFMSLSITDDALNNQKRPLDNSNLRFCVVCISSWTWIPSAKRQCCNFPTSHLSYTCSVMPPAIQTRPSLISPRCPCSSIFLCCRQMCSRFRSHHMPPHPPHLPHPHAAVSSLLLAFFQTSTAGPPSRKLKEPPTSFLVHTIR